jgi:hypothetical protein
MVDVLYCMVCVAEVLDGEKEFASYAELMYGGDSLCQKHFKLILDTSGGRE